MTTITISLPEECTAKLKELAKEKGVAPEDLVRDHVEEWLSEPEPRERDFASASAYVLKKNADLYQRLS